MNGKTSEDKLKARVAALEAELDASRETVRRLQARESLTGRFFENSPSGLFHFDRKGVITFCNPAFAAFVGVTPEQMVGFDMPKMIEDERMRETVATALRGERAYYEGVYRSVSAGKRTSAKVFFTPFFDDAGAPDGGMAVVEDITEEVRCQRALSRSESIYRAVFEEAPDPLLLADPETGRITDANEAAADLLGRSRESLAGMHQSAIHPDSKTARHEFEEHMRRMREGTVPAPAVEHTVIRADGGRVPVEIHARQTEIDGRPTVLAIFRDITRRKMTETALEQRILALTRPLEDTQELCFSDLFNIDEIQRIQDAFAEATGVASVVTRPDGTALTRPSNFRRLCSEVIRRTETGHDECVFEGTRPLDPSPDGPLFFTCLAGGLWGGGATIWVGDTHVANWLVGQVLDDTLSDETLIDRAAAMGADPDLFRTALGEVTRMPRERFTKIRDALQLFARQLSRLALQNVQQAREISARREAEAALRKSEERYRLLFENSPISLWEEDFSELRRYLADLRASGVEDLGRYFDDHPEELVRCGRMIRVMDVNHATLTLFEAGSKADLYGSLEKILPPEPTPLLREEVLAVADGRMLELECVNRTLTGRFLTVLVKSSLMPGYEETWEKVIVSIYDRTRQREMERERERMASRLLHAQKMDAIGTLAGGIAHEFNNAIFAINGNLELLEMHLDADEKSGRYISAIGSSSQRMAHLTAQLLAYAEGGSPSREAIDLNVFIRDMLRIMKHSLSPDIRIETNLAEDLPRIRADHIQIQMVLSALLLNADESIQTDGVITLTTAVRELDLCPREVYPGLQPGEYACLTVSDTGVGMDEETRSRLFDPFFTTKFQGRGLGLSAVYGIVKNHGGWISVDSAPGRGTTVDIRLPTATA